jgi:hypothetical protein
MRLTADEFADALEKWPADTPIEEIEIWGIPVTEYCVVDNDEKIPLLIKKNGKYQISPATLKFLDENRIKPKPH